MACLTTGDMIFRGVLIFILLLLIGFLAWNIFEFNKLRVTPASGVTRTQAIAAMVISIIFIFIAFLLLIWIIVSWFWCESVIPAIVATPPPQVIMAPPQVVMATPQPQVVMANPAPTYKRYTAYPTAPGVAYPTAPGVARRSDLIPQSFEMQEYPVAYSTAPGVTYSTAPGVTYSTAPGVTYSA